MSLEVVLVWVLLAGTAALVVLQIALRRKAARVSKERLAKAEAEGEQLPVSLHPIINTDICIGSLSCIKACPEGDIIGIVNGAAHLVEASNCVGHGRCAAECPVGAITLVFGTSQRGVDLPEVDGMFQSSRAGVHIVGELGGMGLIKNAMTQGIQVADHLSEMLVPGKRRNLVDVAVVGAGPAGLATAVTLKQHGLRFALLEQESLGGTIAHYPRQKVVMSEPVELPGYGKVFKRFISKEELLETWTKVLKRTQVRVEERVRVEGIDGLDGGFVLRTSRGELAARKVVLAIGRRGTPRRLGVPGEDLPKLSYRLVDPEQYDGARVLVVGGGDSALEAAAMLAERGQAEVTLIHRGERFGRAREQNRRKVAELHRQKRLVLAFQTQVRRIEPEKVVLDVAGTVSALKNDYVIVCTGGELPTEFLRGADIEMRRLYGTPMDAVTDELMMSKPRRRPTFGAVRDERAERAHRRLVIALWGLGVAITLGLVAAGRGYYFLGAKERLASPLHAWLRPAGPWGHGVGIVATAFLFTNFLYSVRKRVRAFKRSGSLRGWLTAHQFVGFMAPVAISFHAAFQSKNQLATFTAASLAVVVLTGLVGRYLFGLVPSHEGKAVEYEEVKARWERLRARIEPVLMRVTNVLPIRELLESATRPPQGPLWRQVVRSPWDRAKARAQLLRLKGLFLAKEDFDEFSEGLLRLQRLRLAVSLHQTMKRLLGGWRLFHAALAILLVGMIALHIGIELYLGYRWIF